jgi:hypothetical protein
VDARAVMPEEEEEREEEPMVRALSARRQHVAASEATGKSESRAALRCVRPLPLRDPGSIRAARGLHAVRACVARCH